jgi:hypothetical protein
MAGNRTLKLTILGDTDNLLKSLKGAETSTETFGERVSEFGKKAAIAFAAAGAAVTAFAVSAVKAAAEDEAAQIKLAETIRSTTKATADQIAGVEDYITQTSIAVGVTDDNLRPAFSRLVRSTKDVEDAQKLLNLALDLSAATGKPLESVSNALGRAYDGNTLALGKLGLGLDASILKSGDFDAIFQQLNGTFGDFAENAGQSTQKQLERVQIALDEAKESVGAALLPVVQELTQFILVKFVPALNAFIDGLTGKKSVQGSLTESQKTAEAWGKKIRSLIDTIIEFKDELTIVAGVIATLFVVNKIAAGVSATILLIQGLAAAYTALRNSAAAAAIASRFALNPLAGLGTAAALVGAIVAATRLFDNQADAAALAGGNTVRAESLPGGFTAGTRITPSGTVVSGGAVVTGGGTVVSGAAVATTTKPAAVEVTKKSAEEIGDAFANSFRGLVGGTPDVAGFRAFEETGSRAGLALPIGPTFDPARFRMGEERSLTINVNAPSIIDKPAFAEAVVDALNEAQYRSGAGGSQLIL